MLKHFAFLHNYSDGPKFSDLYLAKFLDTSAKSFSACKVTSLTHQTYFLSKLEQVHFSCIETWEEFTVVFLLV